MASAAYEYFEVLKGWNKVSSIRELERVMRPIQRSSVLFNYLYKKVKLQCTQLKPRKNGEFTFVHPLNVVLNLLKARVNDELIFCGAIMHDFIEEEVDKYRDNHKIDQKTKKGIEILDQYEKIAFKELEVELHKFASSNNINSKTIDDLIEILKLLTRCKRDFYYESISNIFKYKSREIKEKAIQIKLADRMHNILCIDCFSEEERIYQCYKNLFILNSTKKYLIEQFGKSIFSSKKPVPFERLFNKCCKATYEAFVIICRLSSRKGITDIISMLQLSFKKYAFEREGVTGVTKLKRGESHLVRLFQSVIRKYDRRLRHEWNLYKKRKVNEVTYCKKFFKDYKFSEAEIRAIIDYKDAYALREIVTYLLYKPNYVISGFDYKKVFKR
jgi:hypothetical protein